MATCKQSAYELIQDIFSPCVAVLCSDDAETVCAKNNLSFVEMVQPFCRLNTEITIQDPSNTPISIKNLRIIMKSMHSQSPSLAVGKKMMHDAVSSNVLPASDSVFCSSVSTEIYKLEYAAATPWFEAYRDVFFQLVSSTEHEFMHHFLSCIFVVSSSHQDPLSQIHDLCQQQSQHQLQNSQHNSRWFFSYIFKYYLLLHDVSSENLAKAEAVYQSMKSSFGASSCHLLQINSASETEWNGVKSPGEMNGTLNIPDPWSQFLPRYSSQDIAVNDHNEVTNDNFSQQNDNSFSHVNNDVNHLNSSDKEVTINHPLLNNSEDLVLANDSFVGKSSKDFIVRTTSFGSGNLLKKSNQSGRHGICLTLTDTDRIRVFVQEFCIQGLVPFIEKQIKILTDQVANRKSIHRTIFGVTKKFFAGNKPGVQSPAASSNSVVYGQDAPELQVRKLGDLAFMFQLFEVAYQAYHTAKRDFSADQAWLYFAGASEMAALSVFMQGSSSVHEYPARYIETAIVTYLNTCKLPELATRATFLSTECLKAKNLYRDAALQFIRMPSEADLPSALCLEQAAYCFINCKPPKIRKYAFHMILAGHRFSKAGQRKHALRAYQQAEQVYCNIGWNFANSHISAMIGRFSVLLNQLENAYSAFKILLSTPNQQPNFEQASYLKEYLYALKQLQSQKLNENKYELPNFPIPSVNSSSLTVLLGEDNVQNDDGSLIIRGRGFSRGGTNNNIWIKLEEMVVNRVQKGFIFHSPQLQCLTANTDNSSKPVAVLNEIISVKMVLQNPLNIPLTLENIFLLWTFTLQDENCDSNDSVCITNEHNFNEAISCSSVVQTDIVKCITIEALQEVVLHLTLKPLKTGELLIRGVLYNLISPLNVIQDGEKSPDRSKPTVSLSLQGKQIIELKGQRLNRNLAERATKLYAIDNRLSFIVTRPMPKLQVKYHSFPQSLFCGEVHQTSIEFCNIGEAPLQKIIIASPTLGLFAVGLDGEIDNSFQIYKEVPFTAPVAPVLSEWEHCDWLIEVLMPDGSPIHLNPGESLTFPFWLRGPEIPGEQELFLLYYYESVCPNTNLRYRLLQHSCTLNMLPSLQLQAGAIKSYSFDDQHVSNFLSSCANSLVLSLTTENISEDLIDVSIMQVSCVSGKWSLCFTNECYQKGMPVIHLREVLNMTLKAVSISPNVAVSSQKAMVFSHIPMGRVQVDSSATPCSDFTCRSQLNLSNFLSLDTKQLTTENDKQSEERYRTKREYSATLLLTVIWKAKVEQNDQVTFVTGQHHISIEPASFADIGPNVPVQYENPSVSDRSSAQVSSSLVADQFVKCFLNHPFHVQHNFKQQRVKVVPVEFLAQNISSTKVHLVVRTNHPARFFAGMTEENQYLVSQHFSWVNGSKREIVLKSDETASILLQASFCGPGTYNLGSIHVSIMQSDGTAIIYPLCPYLIVISACDLPIN